MTLTHLFHLVHVTEDRSKWAIFESHKINLLIKIVNSFTFRISYIC